MHTRMHSFTHTHTLHKHSLKFNIGLNDAHVCDIQTHAHAPRAGSSENTYILSLSLIDEEMLTQTNIQNLHPKPHYICVLFLELQLRLSRPDVSSRSASSSILSFSLPDRALPDCLLVFPGGSQLPFPGKEVEVGAQPTTYFPPLKAEGQQWFLLSIGCTGRTSTCFCLTAPNYFYGLGLGKRGDELG